MYFFKVKYIHLNLEYIDIYIYINLELLAIKYNLIINDRISLLIYVITYSLLFDHQLTKIVEKDVRGFHQYFSSDDTYYH
jgi:hypothetical protein